MSSFDNTGYAKKNNNIIDQANVTVHVIDAATLEISKVVDKPGEYYSQGDSITFTITISLPSNAPAKLYGITFEDEVPIEVLLPITTPFGVSITGTGGASGTIVSPTAAGDNSVKITGIDLDPGDSVTITIAGTIA